jgi:imidazolonepropionase-like amidohydrolase
MGACRNPARCRGIADKVGSHRSLPKLVYSVLWWEAASAAMGACRNPARCRGIADKVGSHQVSS